MALIRFIIILFIIVPFAGSGQNISTHSNLIDKIKSTKVDPEWKVTSVDDQIYFSLIYSYKPCVDLSPIRRDGFIKQDTLILKLQFEPGWTIEKSDTICTVNEKLLNNITNRVIHHFDSVGWRIKANPEMVRNNPLTYWRFLNTWTESELKQIREIRRIPNLIINNTGIFIDLNYHCIESEEIQNKLSKLKHTLEKDGFGINTEISYHTLYK